MIEIYLKCPIPKRWDPCSEFEIEIFVVPQSPWVFYPSVLNKQLLLDPIVDGSKHKKNIHRIWLSSLVDTSYAENL